MTVSRSLKQLLRIRSLEEEQSRTALEFAIGELSRIEASIALSHEREHAGRHLVAKSHRMITEDPASQGIDRRAGLEESVAARRRIDALIPRVAAQKNRVEELRTAFLSRRVARRQAETLISEAAVRHEAESLRHTQQGLDDWFGARRSREIAHDASVRGSRSAALARKK